MRATYIHTYVAAYVCANCLFDMRVSEHMRWEAFFWKRLADKSRHANRKGCSIRFKSHCEHLGCLCVCIHICTYTFSLHNFRFHLQGLCTFCIFAVIFRICSQVSATLVFLFACVNLYTYKHTHIYTHMYTNSFVCSSILALH